MFLQILLLLCLFPLHVFCMEDNGRSSASSSSSSSSETSEEKSSIELVEIKIDKNKRIKTLDAANVVASYSSQEWPNYTIKSSIIAEVITEKILHNNKPDTTHIQHIKDLKKNNSEQYQRLVTEIFDMLSHTNVDTSELHALRTLQYTYDIYELKRKTEELQDLQKWIPYFDATKKHWKDRDLRFCIGMTLAISGFVEAFCLIFLGTLSEDCWS